jgi:L-threonylcarbamoyladenylate synthase
MKTRIIAQNNTTAIKEVLDAIRSGDVVAVPTDTVYGIACSVNDPVAIQTLYEIKIRESIKAIPVLIADLDQIDQVASNFNGKALRLAQAFWPGALTIIVEKNMDLPKNLTIHPTVGIRIPDHDWLRAIMRKTGPLATTSANISGGTSPTSPSQVLAQLQGRIELIIDGGECKGGISSTVVDCTTDEIVILRNGGITPEAIDTALGK